MGPQFLITTCQPGAESALKQEVAVAYPTLKFSYSRPGFITFKVPQDFKWAKDFGADLVFALVRAQSLGKVAGALLTDRAQVVATTAKEKRATTIHVFRAKPLDEEDSALAEIQTAILGFAPGLSSTVSAQTLSALVLSVIVLGEEEWWVGLHEHTKTCRAWPGGQYPQALPPTAPSRAYLKMEEAIDVLALPVRRADLAIELGSSPGGASFSLLERGLKVVGVDPGAMSPQVLQHTAGFTHFKGQALQLKPQDVQGAQWLFSDMNISGDEAIRAIEKVSKMIGPSLLGGFVTLKMKSWAEVTKLNDWKVRLQEMGFAQVRLAHLFNNRTEVCAAYLTELGRSRKS